jgi:hypothetical protein
LPHLPSWSQTRRVADWKRASTSSSKTFWTMRQKLSHKFVTSSSKANIATRRRQHLIEVLLIQCWMLMSTNQCGSQYPKCHWKIRR